MLVALTLPDNLKKWLNQSGEQDLKMILREAVLEMSGVVSDSKDSQVHKSRTDLFLLLLLLTSLSLNVYLGWRVRQATPPSSVQQSTFKLSPGMKVEPFTAIGANGEPVTISYGDSDKPTVFYVLSPSCIWCERNQANIDRLAEAKGNEFRFIGLSLYEPGLKEYLEKHRLKFPTYTRLTSETINSLGLGGTPQTIVISPEGRVLKNWSGAYMKQLQPELEKYFQVSLPGLTGGSP